MCNADIQLLPITCHLALVTQLFHTKRPRHVCHVASEEGVKVHYPRNATSYTRLGADSHSILINVANSRYLHHFAQSPTYPV